MVKNSTLIYYLNNLEEFESYVIQTDEFINQDSDEYISCYFENLMQDIDDRVVENIIQYSKTGVV